MNFTKTVRPQELDDIIGQNDIVNRLKISCKAARNSQSSLPHSLLDGPGGLGKTTLACAIANELDSDIKIINGGNCGTIRMIMPVIHKLRKNDVLFIDEIHRVPSKVAEFLYPIMEDFRMDFGGKQDKISIGLETFTLIGATTEAGSLASPFYDRFVYKFNLSYYSNEDLCKIIVRSADKIGLIINNDVAINLANRCRGVPRVANNMLTWIRDVCFAGDIHVITMDILDYAMKQLNIDKNGFTQNDKLYLLTLKNSKVPLGLKSIVDITGIDEYTIVNVIEPFLLRNNLISRTTKGRIINE